MIGLVEEEEIEKAKNKEVGEVEVMIEIIEIMIKMGKTITEEIETEVKIKVVTGRIKEKIIREEIEEEIGEIVDKEAIGDREEDKEDKEDNLEAEEEEEVVITIIIIDMITKIKTKPIKNKRWPIKLLFQVLVNVGQSATSIFLGQK